MKLKAEQKAKLAYFFEEFFDDVLEDRQLARQRLVPLKEAQQIADTFDKIKMVVEEVQREILDEVQREIARPFPVGSARSRLNKIESLCNHAILSMHDHFHRGRKRPRL